MLKVVSVEIRCNLRSAVDARSSWKGVSSWKSWTETCNRFEAEGNVEIWYGLEGAGNVALEGKKTAKTDVRFYRARSTSPRSVDQSFQSAR